MPVHQLSGRALVTVDGADAAHFLQNLVTCDVDGLPEGEARPCALLSPQGKILFFFLVSRASPGGFRLDVDAASAADLVKRLTLYRLRAKVNFSVENPIVVAISWQGDSAASRTESDGSRGESASSEVESALGAARDTRFVGPVFRHYAAAMADTADANAWTALRVAHGVAEPGEDFALGDAFPHDALMDQNGGVGFAKGCYVGQEVVSRMQHRGTARRRIMIVSGDLPLPPTGTPVMAGEREAGTLGSVAGDRALAMVRIDRVKAALDSGTPVTAGGIPLAFAFPPGVRFGWPQAADGDG